MRGHEPAKGSVGTSVTPSVSVNDMAPTGERVATPASPARPQNGARGNDQPMSVNAGPAQSRPTNVPVIPTNTGVGSARGGDVPSGTIPTRNGKL